VQKTLLTLSLLLALLAGCADNIPSASFAGVKKTYNQKETCNFCVKSGSAKDVVCHVRLESAAADGAWREVTGDLQAVDAKDKKNVDRKITAGSSLCETWIIGNTIKENKLALPGIFRLAGYCFKQGEQDNTSKAVRFFSEAFEIKQ